MKFIIDIISLKFTEKLVHAKCKLTDVNGKFHTRDLRLNKVEALENMQKAITVQLKKEEKMKKENKIKPYYKSFEVSL